MTTAIWIYKQTEPTLWTVGHYWNDGDRDHFEPESDHGTPAEAAARVRHLNGGGPVGICGARLNYPSSYDGANVLCVCTKTPGHVGAGDDEHEDGTRGGAPRAKWTDPR